MSTLITLRLPDEQVVVLDAAAAALNLTRAEIVRLALYRYLEDFDDLTVAVERINDFSDPVLNWNETRSVLLAMGTEQSD